MEDDLKKIKMEDNLNFLLNLKDSHNKNGRQPQKNGRQTQKNGRRYQ